MYVSIISKCSKMVHVSVSLMFQDYHYFCCIFADVYSWARFKDFMLGKNFGTEVFWKRFWLSTVFHEKYHQLKLLNQCFNYESHFLLQMLYKLNFRNLPRISAVLMTQYWTLLASSRTDSSTLAKTFTVFENHCFSLFNKKKRKTITSGSEHTFV